MEKELHLHKLSLTPDLSLGPGDTGNKPDIPARPSLEEMGQTPSSAPDREAVAEQETEFIGSVSLILSLSLGGSFRGPPLSKEHLGWHQKVIIRIRTR